MRVNQTRHDQGVGWGVDDFGIGIYLQELIQRCDLLDSLIEGKCLSFDDLVIMKDVGNVKNFQITNTFRKLRSSLSAGDMLKSLQKYKIFFFFSETLTVARVR